jgi:murein DD-endopeptidase MepM/ murein hydrolase activator NlpD
LTLVSAGNHYPEGTNPYPGSFGYDKPQPGFDSGVSRRLAHRLSFVMLRLAVYGPRPSGLIAILTALATSACLRADPRVAARNEPVPMHERDSTDAVVSIEQLLALKSLLIPVQGVDADRLRDTYGAARGVRVHGALDIMASRGTPVIAADGGRILRLGSSPLGGISLYQIDSEGRFVYYYAHLDRFEDGLKAGMELRQGDVIGYVGTTGNAPPDVPHLHFQMMIYRRDGRYWEGDTVNPYPLLTRSVTGSR